MGEFLILAGSYRALGWPAALATVGVVFAAVYLLKMIQLTLWGPITKEENRALRDLDLREWAALVPLCVLMLWIGVAPKPFLRPSLPALDATLKEFQQELKRPAVAEATLRPPAPRPPSPGREGENPEIAADGGGTMSRADLISLLPEMILCGAGSCCSCCGRHRSQPAPLVHGCSVSW